MTVGAPVGELPDAAARFLEQGKKAGGRALHICMVLSTPIPPREGVGFYVWNLSNELVRQGHQVQLVTRGRLRRPSRETLGGITVWRSTFVPAYPFHVHLQNVWLRGLVRDLEDSVDLFHLHTPLPPPVVTRRPIALTVHSLVRDDLRNLQVRTLDSLLLRLQRPMSCRLEGQLLARASRTYAVSPQTAEKVQEFYRPAGAIGVLWNGVDTGDFAPPPFAERDERLVLSVGRLALGKGVEDLISAAALVVRELGDTRFLIVGDGPQRSRLERQVRDAGLADHVQFTGHISRRSELIGLYRRATLFVTASHHEGLPTVLLEAMACGCPVVATAVGGVPSLVTSPEDGVLVQAQQPQELADAIGTLLRYPADRRAMSARAHETVAQRFSWPAIARHHVSEYEALLRGELGWEAGRVRSASSQVV